MYRFKKWGCILAAALLLMPVLAGCSSEKEKVVIFSSMEDYRNEELEKQLKEKFPDFKVVVQQLATGDNAAKIKAEGTKTEADIVLGLETASFAEIADNFASLSEFSTEQFLEGVNGADDRYFVWEKADGAFIVNTQVLQEKNLPVPQNYEDLLKPVYKNLIVMPSPKTSNTGYMFVNTWYNTMGKEKALDYVDKLQGNIKDFTKSGSGPVKMLISGEAAIGLGMVFQAAAQITEGSPLQIVQPEEGCPYNTTSFGIIKGRDEKENVTKVFNFLNEEFIRYDKEYFCPGLLLKDQENHLENYPTDIHAADMSTIGDADLKQELLKAWKY